MKNTNTLTINQATLVDALQEYLNKRITPNVSVVKAYTFDPYNNQVLCDNVVVTLEEIKLE